MKKKHQFFIKNIIDLTGSISLLLLLLPVFLITSLSILIFLGSPIFFKQKRIGKNSKVFYIYKFRSLTNAKDNNGNLLKDQERLTKFGTFLRHSSLDEIPQLINIIKGELSLIGPRPLLPEYLPLYSQNQSRRHEVKPGISGWAQVKGRNSLNWRERFTYDVWYIDNWSLLLDFKIFLLTFRTLFSQNGVQTKEKNFMPKFNGKN